MSEPICKEFSHSFFDHSEALLVGYKCESTWIFLAVVVFAFFLVILQNFLATKDSQASRAALTTKKGSKQREQIIRKLLIYTFTSSLLGTLHVLLVIGANAYILLALMLGNATGVYFSYKSQKEDEHDCSGDLRAILKAVKEHPDKEKWSELRLEMQSWLQIPPPNSNKDDMNHCDQGVSLQEQPKQVIPLQIVRGPVFEPYTDVPMIPRERRSGRQLHL